MQLFTTTVALSLAAFAVAVPTKESHQSAATIRFINGTQVQDQKVNFGQRIDTDIHAKNAQLRTNGVTCELLINQSSNTVSLVNRTRVDLEELNVRVVSGISCEAAE